MMHQHSNSSQMSNYMPKKSSFFCCLFSVFKTWRAEGTIQTWTKQGVHQRYFNNNQNKVGNVGRGYRRDYDTRNMAWLQTLLVLVFEHKVTYCSGFCEPKWCKVVVMNLSCVQITNIVLFIIIFQIKQVMLKTKNGSKVLLEPTDKYMGLLTKEDIILRA